MGLGKTPLSLAFAEQNDCTKVIIITINAKATETIDIGGSWLNWASQSSIKYKLFSKSSSSFDFSKDNAELLIINYESLFVRGNSSDRKQKSNLKKQLCVCMMF